MAGRVKFGQLAFAGALVSEDPQDQPGDGQCRNAIGGGDIKGVRAHWAPNRWQKSIMSLFPNMSFT